MNKGFTLIELLAVIVILAVIALIATPIVLSIINDIKESAVIRSAEFYVDAVQNKIMQENMKLGGTLNPKECIVEEISGDVKCDGGLLEIEVDGDKPDGGSITFENGRVTGITLKFGDRKVIQNSKDELVLSDNIEVCTLISGPANEIGSKYECEVKPGTKYNFYVLSSETNETTNLIMERNICDDGSVATAENKCTVAWVSRKDYNDDTNYDPLGNNLGNNNKGPITAMNYLNKATSSWINIENLNITYNDEGNKYTSFKITGKARLPYLSEVNSYDGANGYLYDYLYIGNCYDNSEDLNIVECKYAGYIDGVYEEEMTKVQDIMGYWALSSRSDSTSFAMLIDYIGTITSSDVGYIYGVGVRPVINVKL